MTVKKGWSFMRRHVHRVGCKTSVQALRVAHAVNEARIVAFGWKRKNRSALAVAVP